jgi:hypothetical protein
MLDPKLPPEWHELKVELLFGRPLIPPSKAKAFCAGKRVEKNRCEQKQESPDCPV